MHRCLEIPEVLSLILGNLSPEEPLDSRALASFARTAKVFQDPALDILWKTQDSAVNLLRCMPADVFRIVPNPVDGIYRRQREMRLLRPIMAADWERPALYMNRVRVLTSPGLSDTSLSQILPALAASLPFDAVFPKLTSLTWSLTRGDDFHYLRLFLTRVLTSIAISLEHSAHHLSLLSLLDRKCPALKNVSLFVQQNPVEPSGVSPMIGRAISAFLCAQRDLHSLASRITDMAALEHVAQLPNLRSIRAIRLPPTILPTPAVIAPRFPQLRHLDLDYVTVEQAIDLLGMCTKSPLERLEAVTRGVPTAAACVLFSAALAACHTAHPRLTACDLDFSNDGEATDDGAQYIIPTNFLRNLNCFAHLTHFNIATLAGFDLGDSEIAGLARAWPLIEDLRLEAAMRSAMRSPTLRCISIIAQHCPRLRSLHMTFDTDGEIPVWTQQPPSQTSLTDLNVGHSPIHAVSTAAAARFLSAVFPNLQNISTQREYEEGETEEDFEGTDLALYQYHELWKEVEVQIPLLVAVRAEGLRWGQNKC
ncbi:hypothetical protein C8R46DRAFT_938891 [Mycena filopes]|nr:hypothetical protein C8R46DRAFT_938891 [Mycena filopes]